MYKNKQKQREYAREWVAKRRREFFENRKCKTCGKITSLQLHHVNRKEKEGHAIWSWSKERREAEIAKCIILCSECHIELHAKEKRILEHGTCVMYRKGCRCRLCKDAHTARLKEYRLRIKSK